MATSDGVKAAWAILSLAWPERVSRLAADSDGVAVLVSLLQEADDRDLVNGCRSLVTTRTTLYPGDNPVALALDAAHDAKGRRLDAERAEAVELEARRQELQDIHDQLRPISAAEQALLDGPIPKAEHEAWLHRRRVACIRKRMGISIHARNELSRRRRELEASGVTLLLEDNHAA